MSQHGTDPLEERDIQKILDALDDPRVIKKIANALAIKCVGGSQSAKTDISYNIIPKPEIQEIQS